MTSIRAYAWIQTLQFLKNTRERTPGSRRAGQQPTTGGPTPQRSDHFKEPLSVRLNEFKHCLAPLAVQVGSRRRLESEFGDVKIVEDQSDAQDVDRLDADHVRVPVVLGVDPENDVNGRE